MEHQEMNLSWIAVFLFCAMVFAYRASQAKDPAKTVIGVRQRTWFTVAAASCGVVVAVVSGVTLWPFF